MAEEDLESPSMYDRATYWLGRGFVDRDLHLDGGGRIVPGGSDGTYVGRREAPDPGVEAVEAAYLLPGRG